MAAATAASPPVAWRPGGGPGRILIGGKRSGDVCSLTRYALGRWPGCTPPDVRVPQHTRCYLSDHELTPDFGTINTGARKPPCHFFRAYPNLVFGQRGVGHRRSAGSHADTAQSGWQSGEGVLWAWCVQSAVGSDQPICLVAFRRRRSSLGAQWHLGCLERYPAPTPAAPSARSCM